jgi:hypothetical protein
LISSPDLFEQRDPGARRIYSGCKWRYLVDFSNHHHHHHHHLNTHHEMTPREQDLALNQRKPPLT